MSVLKHCLMGSPRRVYGTLLAGKNARLSGYEVWGPVHTHPDSQQAVARRALRNASLPDHRHGAPGGPVFFLEIGQNRKRRSRKSSIISRITCEGEDKGREQRADSKQHTQKGGGL